MKKNIFLIVLLSFVVLQCKNRESSKKIIFTKTLKDQIVTFQERNCLSQKDTLLVKNKIYSILESPHTEKYFHENYHNPDDIALRNLVKYEAKIASLDFINNGKLDAECSIIIARFNYVSEIYVDDESVEHAIENSIIIKFIQDEAQLKIIDIRVIG